MQAIIIHGSGTWVLTAPMLVVLEVVHVGFLRGISRMKTKGQGGKVGTPTQRGGPVVFMIL